MQLVSASIRQFDRRMQVFMQGGTLFLANRCLKKGCKQGGGSQLSAPDPAQQACQGLQRQETEQCCIQSHIALGKRLLPEKCGFRHAFVVLADRPPYGYRAQDQQKNALQGEWIQNAVRLWDLLRFAQRFDQHDAGE